ncbi:Glycoprotein 3-alpha-L-fucosyltransferase A [Holothuria leucospilota]|uniref:Fucosyltransferase n=1 Tax=Holothuria leucospilota TaxID=206669 RepID=A0A9Q0YD38_HOLLE|nr:Glycoprotein 3-alpha-L-fucosyltransferase A [Holothuria leucospilota]
MILLLYSPTFYLIFIKTDLMRSNIPSDTVDDILPGDEFDDSVGHILVHSDNLDQKRSKKDLDFEKNVQNLVSKTVTTVAFYEGFLMKWIYSFEPFESLVECTCPSQSVVYMAMVSEPSEMADYDVTVFPQDIGRRRPTVSEWAALYQTRKRYNKQQWWVYATHDCYTNLQPIIPPQPFAENSFDLSVTYHSKSDIVLSFGHYDRSSYSPQKRRNWAESKEYLIAWTPHATLSSKSSDKPWQDAFLERLGQRIEVHKYGHNGKARKIPTSEIEWRKIMEKYKFHLSFENNCCDEYITETFWQILAWGVVPVVIGAPKEDYLRVAPPHSFVYADKFETLDKFVNYIKLLDSDDELYNEYFKWKEKGRVESHFPFSGNSSSTEREIPKSSIYSCNNACRIAEKYVAESNRNLKSKSEARSYFNPRGKWWAQSCGDCGTHDWIRKYKEGR